MPNNDSVFIFAGEASADLYGAKVIQELKKTHPHTSFFGVGGKKLQDEGLEVIYPLERFSVMGFSDVIKALPRLVKSLFSLKKLILQRKPKLCLFIDSPDFSLRLATRLKKAFFAGKLVQFVAPTVWAYKKKRAKAFASTFDLLLTLFSFEAEHFLHTGLKTVWTGHPLVEEIEPLQKDVLKEKEKIIAIFPGSRPAEIGRNLPIQLEAANLFCNQRAGYEIAISVANVAFKDDVEKILAGFRGKITLTPFAERYELMQKAAFALAKSGTVTLELALFGVPTCISYELSWLNRFIATHILKVDLPFYSIVNILKQKEVFPELIKEKPTPEDLLKKLLSLEGAKSQQIKKECKELFTLLQSEKKPTKLACEAIAKLFYE